MLVVTDLYAEPVLAPLQLQLHAVALLRGSKTDPQRPLPTDPLTIDSIRRRPTKLSHLIEDVTCEDGLRLLPRPTARSKALPDDQLVPEEGVLHTGLLMVARVLLPLSPSSLLHLSDRAVARGRSWSPSRHGGCPGRWNDDRRATRTRSLVDATRVVGRVRREAGDVAFDLVDQIEGRRRVVNMPAGQGVSDDHARSVDAQMKLLPAAYTASAMFHGRPFTGVGARMRAGLRASNRRARHLPMRYETGLPSSVIRFRTLHASTASRRCPDELRARRQSPTIDLYRKNAFSTRAC